jgi:hypothetical protein
MKIYVTAALLLLLLAGCKSAQKPEQIEDPQSGTSTHWNYIVGKYVNGDYFDYAGLAKSSADKKRLEKHMEWQATADVKSMPREGQIAFYINAYNAGCVKMIVDNYPVHSPLDIDGFFDKITFKVAGEDLTVSQIEYDRLIANYLDMRAHFAVVCSDRGCLPLKNEAYTAGNLDTALDERSKSFIADSRQFKVDHEKKTVEISKIFFWYGEKFTRDPKRPAEKPEQYVKYWASEDVKKLLESGQYTVVFKEWEWTLNEKHNTGKSSSGESK